LDILVNNAGTIRRAPAVDYSEADWDLVIQVNLSSVFSLSQLAGRHMLERGRGKILNIASLLCSREHHCAAYAASKVVWPTDESAANEWAAKELTQPMHRVHHLGGRIRRTVMPPWNDSNDAMFRIFPRHARACAGPPVVKD